MKSGLEFASQLPFWSHKFEMYKLKLTLHEPIERLCYLCKRFEKESSLSALLPEELSGINEQRMSKNCN